VVAAVEVSRGHDRIRDVAATSAADQDLRARFLRALEENDPEPRLIAAGEDRCREAGSAGSDDDDVGVSLRVERVQTAMIPATVSARCLDFDQRRNKTASCSTNLQLGCRSRRRAPRGGGVRCPRAINSLAALRASGLNRAPGAAGTLPGMLRSKTRSVSRRVSCTESTQFALRDRR
jgi:hypothetical protein